MLTTSTSEEEEEDSCNTELSHKSKENVDLNAIPANPIATVPQQQQDRNRKDRKHGHTSRSGPGGSVPVCGRTMYNQLTRELTVLLCSQTNITTTACIHTRKISAGKEGHTVSSAVYSSPFRGDCD